MRYLIALASLLLVVACGGDDAESAGDAVERQLMAYGQGQFGRHWDDLHPAHQAIVSRDQYIVCARNNTGASITAVEAIETFEEPMNLARVGMVDTTAVTVRIEAGTREQTTTLHVINIDGAWRWGMTEEAIAACLS